MSKANSQLESNQAAETAITTGAGDHGLSTERLDNSVSLRAVQNLNTSDRSGEVPAGFPSGDSLLTNNRTSAAVTETVESHAGLLERLRSPFDSVKKPDGSGYDLPIFEEWYHNVMDTDWERNRY